jgi:hypothetical protein
MCINQLSHLPCFFHVQNPSYVVPLIFGVSISYKTIKMGTITRKQKAIQVTLCYMRINDEQKSNYTSKKFPTKEFKSNEDITENIKTPEKSRERT